MSSVPNNSVRPPRGRITRRMLLILIPLTIIPLLAMVATFYSFGRDFIRQQAIKTLGALADIQGERFLNQIEIGAVLLNSTLDDPEFRADLRALFELEDGNLETYESIANALVERLDTNQQMANYYADYLILAPDGEILVGSVDEWAGKSISDTEFIATLGNKPISLAVFAPEPLYSKRKPADKIENEPKEIESFVVMTSIPILDQNGAVAAYLIGFADSTIISDHLATASSANQNGYLDRVYLITPEGYFIGVNQLPNSKNELVFLPVPEELEQTFLNNLDSNQDQVFELKESPQTHRQAVFATRNWLEKLQVAWSLEAYQSEIYSQVDYLLQWMLIFIVVVLALTLAAVAVLVRSISPPVLSIAENMQEYGGGNRQKRSRIQRKDEIGYLAESFNWMADELNEYNQHLESQLSVRNQELSVLAQLSQIMITAEDLDDLLQKTLNLLVQRFNLTYATVFLKDQTGYGDQGLATTRQVAGLDEVIKRVKIQRVRVSEANNGSLAGWSIATNRSQVRPLKPASQQGETPIGQTQYFEAAIPIGTDQVTLGAFHMYAKAIEDREPFTTHVVTELQTIANQISSAVSYYQLSEASQINLNESIQLFQAGHQIAQAENDDQVLQIAKVALDQCSYRSAILLTQKYYLKQVYAWRSEWIALNSVDAQLSGLALEEIAPHFSSSAPLIVDRLDESQLPSMLLDIPQSMGCTAAAFLPAYLSNKMVGLMVVGSAPRLRTLKSGETTTQQAMPFSAGNLQPYANLIELITITLDKLHARLDTQQRLADLETLWEISHKIAVETDLDQLFQAIHHQLVQTMGELNTVGIGLFDEATNTIRFPYMYEEGEVIDIPTIPLGQGLTSLVLRTKKPLLLVENTEQKTRELGALTVGKPAKSWMGVPLLFGGDAIGIIIVQDNVNEHRFTEQDQRLLSTMAAQVSVAVRNARLLEASRNTAEKERISASITSKVWASTSVDVILRTALEELGTSLDAAEGYIQLNTEEQ